MIVPTLLFVSGALAQGRDAASSVLAAFDRAPLVALAEHHRRAEVHQFLLDLVDRPEFGKVVDDIVVEFGNALYQDVVDRYVSGGEVPRADLARAWRDTTQWLVWDSPLYERFFERVRERNRGRPEAERVRVVLGDPPIDWDQVKTAADYRAFADRDVHFATTVEREVLAKHRRGLLVAGAVHLQRRGPIEAKLPGGPGVAELLHQHSPGALFIVWTLPADAELARTLGFDRAPSLRLLDADSLGVRSFALIAAKGVQIQVAGEWKPLGEIAWPPMREVVDALLYVGASDTQMDPDRSIYRDERYQSELRRRAAILSAVYGMEFLPQLEELLATDSSAR